VYNLSRGNQKIQFYVADVGPTRGEWDLTEAINFYEEVEGRMTLTWQVQFRGDSEATRPGDGDVFLVKTRKPFAEDVFAFTTTAARTDGEKLQEDLRNIYAVPNPYVVTNEIEPRNPVSRTERGDRRMYFANVPSQCTIRIYSLAGELVDVIEHDGGLDDGKAYWDLRSKDNMNIAYGLYFFHVESTEGTFTGKFAVIK
ncbi:MAG: T9SS type A sorting domain-containing protein, partial [Rhodothermales bacterium]